MHQSMTGIFTTKAGQWLAYMGLAHAASDAIMVISYMYIFFMIYTYTKGGSYSVGGEDLSFARPIVHLTLSFIVLCGFGHIVNIASIWYPYHTVFSVGKISTSIIAAIMSMYIYRYRQKGYEVAGKITISNRKYAIVFEKAPVGLVVIGRNGLFKDVNQNFCEFIGYSRNELIGLMGFEDFTYHEGHDPDFGIPSDLFSSDTIGCSLTKRFIHGKTRKVLHAKLGMFVVKNGHPEIVATITDIGQEIKARDKINRSLKELAVLNKELERFVYVSSHDLQEPLRTIKMFSGMLSDSMNGRLIKEEETYLNFIINASTKMQNLIKDLLEYSKLSKNTDKWQNVKMQRIFTEAFDSLMALSSKNHATVNIDLGDIEEFGNEVQLTSLAANLLSNAIKFTREGEHPVVNVGYSKSDSSVAVYFVEDGGIGIEKEYRGKVFDVFSRLSSKNEYDGTGIGLSICDKIIKSHGGKIWIDGNSRNGTTVRFTIGNARMRHMKA